METKHDVYCAILCKLCESKFIFADAVNNVNITETKTYATRTETRE